MQQTPNEAEQRGPIPFPATEAERERMRAESASLSPALAMLFLAGLILTLLWTLLGRDSTPPDTREKPTEPPASPKMDDSAASGEPEPAPDPLSPPLPEQPQPAPPATPNVP